MKGLNIKDDGARGNYEEQLRILIKKDIFFYSKSKNVFSIKDIIGINKKNVAK
jgi:hypothetical protein